MFLCVQNKKSKRLRRIGFRTEESSWTRGETYFMRVHLLFCSALQNRKWCRTRLVPSPATQSPLPWTWCCFYGDHAGIQIFWEPFKHRGMLFSTLACVCVCVCVCVQPRCHLLSAPVYWGGVQLHNWISRWIMAGDTQLPCDPSNALMAYYHLRSLRSCSSCFISLQSERKSSPGNQDERLKFHKTDSFSYLQHLYADRPQH